MFTINDDQLDSHSDHRAGDPERPEQDGVSAFRERHRRQGLRPGQQAAGHTHRQLPGECGRTLARGIPQRSLLRPRPGRQRARLPHGHERRQQSLL